LKQYDYEDQQVIDVESFESVPNDAVFRRKAAARRAESDAALEELKQEVMQDPERCFCRNCGNPVMKTASVCVSCHYVMNPQALQLGAQRIRERRARFEKSHRVFQFINKATGVDLESDTSKALFEVTPQNFAFRTTGAVYCTNCGCQVDEGASVCVRCNFIMNPAAIRQAQLSIIDKNAKMTPKLFLKSLLIPGFGKKMRMKWQARRPQIARPCGLLGKINLAALIAGAALIFYFL